MIYNDFKLKIKRHEHNKESSCEKIARMKDLIEKNHFIWSILCEKGACLQCTGDYLVMEIKDLNDNQREITALCNTCDDMIKIIIEIGTAQVLKVEDFNYYEWNTHA